MCPFTRCRFAGGNLANHMFHKHLPMFMRDLQSEMGSSIALARHRAWALVRLAQAVGQPLGQLLKLAEEDLPEFWHQGSLPMDPGEMDAIRAVCKQLGVKDPGLVTTLPVVATPAVLLLPRLLRRLMGHLSDEDMANWIQSIWKYAGCRRPSKPPPGLVESGAPGHDHGATPDGTKRYHVRAVPG